MWPPTSAADSGVVNQQRQEQGTSHEHEHRPRNTGIPQGGDGGAVWRAEPTAPSTPHRVVLRHRGARPPAQDRRGHPPSPFPCGAGALSRGIARAGKGSRAGSVSHLRRRAVVRGASGARRVRQGPLRPVPSPSRVPLGGTRARRAVGGLGRTTGRPRCRGGPQAGPRTPAEDPGSSLR